jgi:hypothetical protein
MNVIDALTTIVGAAAKAEEYARAAHQSLTEVLEQYQVAVPAPPVFHEVWKKEFPTNVYPTSAEWDIIRAALGKGYWVLADIGANESSLKMIRLIELRGDGVPANAVYQPSALGGGPIKILCPTYGANPNKAVWSVSIWGLEELGA